MSGPARFDELLEQVPETRKQAALRKIIAHNNRCKIFIGGSQNDRYEYPYRLVPSNKATQRLRDCSQELMLDSTIGDPSVTNRSVIQKATELDADWVLPKDYWGDIEETHASIREFLEIYSEENCHAKIIVPLQPPHATHYQRYEDFYSQFSHFALGGMKNADPSEQVQAVKQLRSTLGDHKWLHGLGMGCSEEMIEALRTYSPFLDSLDVSSFEYLPGQCGKIADKNWNQLAFDFPGGDEISTLKACMMEYLVYQANFQLTPFANGNQSAGQSEDENSSNPTDPAQEQTTISGGWGSNGQVEPPTQ